MVPEKLRLSESVVDGSWVVSVSGELDLSSSPELRDCLDGVGDDAPRVVVDLTKATFLDSSGIFTLLTAKNQLEARGRTLEVVCPEDGLVRRALTVTGALRHLRRPARRDDSPPDAS